MKNSFFSKLTVVLFICLIPQDIAAQKITAKSPEVKLKEIFTAKQIQQIKAYKTAFANTNTVADFTAAYRKGAQLKKDLFDAMNKDFEKQSKINVEKAGNYKWLYPFIPGYQSSLVAEGTVVELILYYKNFLAKATKTAEKTDDDFINLMIAAYGEHETFYPVWFNQTWDYGGCSHLGKGIHNKTLVSINNLYSSNKLFKPELNEVREKALNDILKWTTYCSPRENAIKEINQIIKAVPLSVNEKKQLQNRVIKFQKPDKSLQFNCDKANCSYG